MAREQQERLTECSCTTALRTSATGWCVHMCIHMCSCHAAPAGQPAATVTPQSVHPAPRRNRPSAAAETPYRCLHVHLSMDTAAMLRQLLQSPRWLSTASAQQAHRCNRNTSYVAAACPPAKVCDGKLLEQARVVPACQPRPPAGPLLPRIILCPS
jgi:hypothetical protein